MGEMKSQMKMIRFSQLLVFFIIFVNSKDSLTKAEDFEAEEEDDDILLEMEGDDDMTEEQKEKSAPSKRLLKSFSESMRKVENAVGDANEQLKKVKKVTSAAANVIKTEIAQKVKDHNNLDHISTKDMMKA